MHKNDKNIYLFDDFIRQNDVFNDNISIRNKSFNAGKSYVIEIKKADHYYYPEAQANIEINKPPLNSLFVCYMSTDMNNRNKGFGTCLHLMNIVEMLENKKINKIGLHSINSAIPFHIKNGFYPTGSFEKDLKPLLTLISKDETPELSKYAKQAKDLLKVQNMFDFARDKKGNKILYEYTKSAFKYKSKEEMLQLYPKGIDMILKKSIVLKNKDFYNEQFKKYGIDYQI